MRRLASLGLLLFLGCGEAPTIVIEPLEVLVWEPGEGAQCVSARAADFAGRVTFSDDIESASLTASTLFVRRVVDGAIVEPVIDYDKASQTASLTLPADLEFGTVYQLVAMPALEGVKRGRLAFEWTSTFRTVSGAGCL